MLKKSRKELVIILIKQCNDHQFFYAKIRKKLVAYVKKPAP